MVVTRFAPSPTGVLHIGSVRQALFSYLYARRHGGRFVLRIEDTDRERSTEASVQAILQGMDWLGLDYDEGPVYQTERIDRYQKLIDKLVEEGKAYRCYCSKERLADLREMQMKQKIKPKYDGKCRDLDNTARDNFADKPHVIRFKTPTTGSVTFNDAVRGEITVNNSELDDLIIRRQDGMPTYNFTVVVDDADMGITHVVRGDDHLNNTPRQIHIYQALGFNVPNFAHTPMVLGQDGQKLSKRHGAVNVMDYRDMGYLPEALLNFLVRLGWSHGDQEIFSKKEMIELFDLNNINHSASIYNQEKCLWLNQQYIQNTPTNILCELLTKSLFIQGFDFSQGPDLALVVDLYKNRADTLLVLSESIAYLYKPLDGYDEKSVKKHLKGKAFEILKHMLVLLKNLTVEQWTVDSLTESIQSCCERFEVKFPKVAQPLRIALTGGTQSPSIADIMFLMGSKETIFRVESLLLKHNSI